MTNCENCTGDHLTNSRNSSFCFDANDLEFCRYCNEIANGAKYCMDYCMWGINCELLYESSGCGYNVYSTIFSNHCWQNIANILYCESCFPSVKDCFGCFGLRRAQYCIFNKQYTKEEYGKLAGKLIEQMKETKEWGEFFPIRISVFGYNESLAHLFFPLTKEQVMANGWPWRDEEDDADIKTDVNQAIPASIEEAGDDVCKQIFICEATGKPYKVIPQELTLLQQLGVPCPRISPAERHRERAEKRNPRNLWTRPCAKCGKEIQTTYPHSRPETVYCEPCYLKKVH